MARKPIEKGLSVAENCLKWGTGGLDIDGSRVDVADSEKAHFEKEWDRDQSMSAELGGVAMNKGLKAISLRENVPSGRFPANFIHDNSEEVRECFPESKGGAFPKTHGSSGFVSPEEKESRLEMNDSGNASRFFKSILYYSKASKRERNEGMEESRNTHPTVKPVALMEYLIQMISRPGQTILDPFAGSGSTLLAAQRTGRGFIGIEKEAQYIPIIHSRIEAAPEPLF